MTWWISATETFQAIAVLVLLAGMMTAAHVLIVRTPYRAECSPTSEHPFIQKLFHKRQSRRDRIQLTLVREYSKTMLYIGAGAVVVIVLLSSRNF